MGGSIPRALTDEAIAALLPSALGMPAAEGVRLLALHWLRGLERLRIGLVTQLSARQLPLPAECADDVERSIDNALLCAGCLRSILRENRALLGSNRRARRALRRLARHLEGLRQPFMARGRLAGFDVGHTSAGGSDAIGSTSSTGTLRAMVDRLTHSLKVPLAGLDETLSCYSERRTVGQTPARPSLAAHLASRIAESAKAMDAGFADERWRRVQREAMAQRAMLAPFAPSHRGIGAWLHLALATASALRTHRDLTRVAKLAADTPVLRANLDAEALGVLDAWRAGCLRGAVDAARDAIASLEATAAESTLPMEIERKFLLRAAPAAIASVAPLAIEQGWLPGDVLRERLRRSTDENGNVTLTRTVKAGALGARVELEEETTAELFDALWPHTRLARIRKHRHRVREGAFTWEIDVFTDRDLVLAEVELTDASDMPPIPEWLAAYVVRDVTEDLAYTNSVMAMPDAARDASFTA